MDIFPSPRCDVLGWTRMIPQKKAPTYVQDLSARPETELLLSSGRTHGDTPTGACMKAQPGERRVTDEPQHRAESSPSSSLSSRPTSQDKYMRSSRNAQVEGAPGSSGGAITPPSITVNDGAVENDDPPPYTAIPPPYSAIAPPNHVGWPYGGPFSFGNSYSTDASPYTVEVPLAPFQSSRPPAAFHPEETNRQHMSLPMPLTPYRFFKFGYRDDLRGRWPADSRTAEKIEDRGSRKYGAILMAAVVIISLMALSLMVRFIMEKSWWRG